MNLKLSLIVLLLTGTISLANSLQNPTGVHASCNPGRPNQVSSDPAGNWYNGWSKGGSPIILKAHSTLSNYTPYIANVQPPDGGYSAAVAWVGIAEHTPYHPPGLAQIGWEQRNASPPLLTRRTFVQVWHYDSSSGSLVRDLDFFGATPPSYPYLEYEVWAENNNFRFYLNNQLQTSSLITFFPRRAETSAELTTSANQEPGGYMGPMWFLDTRYSINNVWYPLKGSQSSSPEGWLWLGWQLGDPETGFQLKVWDKVCPS